MTLNVGNIELSLAQATSSGQTGLDLLTANKILQQLKTGEVNSVATLADLPASGANIGRIYYVVSEDNIYYSGSGIGWITFTTTTADALFSLGNNSRGNLGMGICGTAFSSPVRESSYSTNWSSVAVGRCHSVALKKDNTIWEWGKGGSSFQTDTPVPCGPVSQCATWCLVSAGLNRALAMGTDGSVWLWGNGGGGALGNNTTATVYSPVREITSSTWSHAATGIYQASQGIKSDGTFWSWGVDNYGMLGKNTCNANTSSPVQEITSSTNWCTGDIGFYNNGGIKTDGTMWAWGVSFNGANLVVPNTYTSSPVQEFCSATNWCKMVWKGGNQPYGGHALKTDGTLWSWGTSGCGNLGNWSPPSSTSTPIQEVTSSTVWCDLDGGSESGRGIKTDGTVWSWGKQFCGEFGIYNQSSTTCYSSPIQEITSSTNWCMVSAGGDYNNGITSMIKSTLL